MVSLCVIICCVFFICCFVGRLRSVWVWFIFRLLWESRVLIFFGRLIRCSRLVMVVCDLLIVFVICCWVSWNFCCRCCRVVVFLIGLRFLCWMFLISVMVMVVLFGMLCISVGIFFSFVCWLVCQCCLLVMILQWLLVIGCIMMGCIIFWVLIDCVSFFRV